MPLGQHSTIYRLVAASSSTYRRRLGEEMESGGADTARLLVLLSLRQRGCGVGAGDVRRGRRAFECKTCGRRFPTFQALGGHRASHRRTRPHGGGAGQLLRRLGRRTPESHGGDECAPGPRAHGCPVCGVESAVGQALGGHMQRHRDAAADGDAVGAGGATLAKDDDGGAGCGGGICLDLKFAPSEDCAKCRKSATLGNTVQGVQETLILDKRALS